MRSLKIISAILVVFVLVFGSFFGGLLAGRLLPRANQTALASVENQATDVPLLQATPTLIAPSATSKPVSPTKTNTPTGKPADDQDLDMLFKPFWEAWQIVHSQFIDQPIDDVALMRGAIRGMVEALGDRHSSYMDPDEYVQASIDLGDEYEGIGAWVDPSGDYLSIITPMSGSPAEEAGLKTGDVILAVDGKDMNGVDGNLVIREIMGPAGSQVMLTILRMGETAPFDVTVTRAKIIIPDIESRMLEDGIGYVRLLTFGAETSGELQTALEDLLSQNPKGIILDLRNNAGGYLDTTLEISSEFFPAGTIVMHEEFADGQVTPYKAIPGGIATEIPLVVLVNQGTASASEILAGAVQDLDRGELVGMTTYGKGSVQNWIELKNQQGLVRVTVARWLTAGKRQIHEVGLVPDYQVELTDADIEAERDPQLDQAIDLLNSTEQ